MKKNAETLHWKCFGPEVVSHLACHRLSRTQRIPLHDHDFAELFWGIEGEAFQSLNGTMAKIETSELFLLRPTDVHEIHTVGDRKFSFFNIAFQFENISRLNNQYKLDLTQHWLEGRDWQRKYRLTPTQLCYLNSAVLDVFKYPNSGMALDRFLLNLFFEIESSSVLPFTKCPQWLQEAISKLNDPKVFQYGANSLAKLSGYSVEYVARTLKKCTGMTPSEVVNQARMEYAAALLATTSNDTYWIAEECGFESMSHFFSCFKRHFSCTPRTYRLNHQKLVIPQK